MPHGGRSLRIGQGSDVLETLLVAPADSFVLALVFLPGTDGELLADATRVSDVAPNLPADRSRHAPGVAAVADLGPCGGRQA